MIETKTLTGDVKYSLNMVSLETYEKLMNIGSYKISEGDKVSFTKGVNFPRYRLKLSNKVKNLSITRSHDKSDVIVIDKNACIKIFNNRLSYRKYIKVTTDTVEYSSYRDDIDAKYYVVVEVQAGERKYNDLEELLNLMDYSDKMICVTDLQQQLDTFCPITTESFNSIHNLCINRDYDLAAAIYVNLDYINYPFEFAIVHGIIYPYISHTTMVNKVSFKMIRDHLNKHVNRQRLYYPLLDLGSKDFGQQVLEIANIFKHVTQEPVNEDFLLYILDMNVKEKWKNYWFHCHFPGFEITKLEVKPNPSVFNNINKIFTYNV